MPNIDERIEALEAKLKQLQVLQQRKEARAQDARLVSIYAALALSTLGLGAVDAANLHASSWRRGME